MSRTLQQRRVGDRRRRSRGGRRSGDREGFAPLVMLVGSQPAVMDRSEAILAKLRFAVTTSLSVEHALRVIPELKPDIVVAGEMDGMRIRRGVSDGVLVILVDHRVQDDPDALVAEILRRVRSSA
jgi:hypothetical protein